MSEFKDFKVGDKVIWLVDDPWQWDVNAIHEIKEHSHGQFKVYLGDEFVCWCGDQVFWQEFRHATPEEIAAGHRIDHIHQSGKLVTDLGDDFPIENHISPMCEVKDV